MPLFKPMKHCKSHIENFGWQGMTRIQYTKGWHHWILHVQNMWFAPRKINAHIITLFYNSCSIVSNTEMLLHKEVLPKSGCIMRSLASNHSGRNQKEKLMRKKTWEKPEGNPLSNDHLYQHEADMFHCICMNFSQRCDFMLELRRQLRCYLVPHIWPHHGQKSTMYLQGQTDKPHFYSLIS